LNLLSSGKLRYTQFEVTKPAAQHLDQPGAFNLKVEFSHEDDGRWIADIPALPGVTVCGRTRKQALASAEALALRVIADRLEHGEAVPGRFDGPTLQSNHSA
jgi:predicted RNase H-like HicB family nuclease